MLTKEESLKLYNSSWWKGKSAEEIVAFQLYEDRLCMPFGEFHEAVEKALGRGVFTHEFAYPEILQSEFEKKIPKQTFADSLALLMKLAKGKPIILLD